MDQNSNANRAFVRNIPFQTTDSELEQAFAQHAAVVEATVITDRETGRSRGFGFVEFQTPEDLNKAIQAMNGQDFGGRELHVDVAHERRR